MYQIISLQAEGFNIMQIAPLLAMFVVLYFLMIRPQVKRQKKEKQFRQEVRKGAKVVMTSGIHGKIVELNDNSNTVVIETGAGKIKFERSAISMELSQKYSENK